MSYYWRRKKPSYEKVDLKMGSCHGENMKDRVKPMAQLYKAETFDVPWTNEQDMLIRNEKWLRNMLPKAERVIDLGIDTGRTE